MKNVFTRFVCKGSPVPRYCISNSTKYFSFKYCNCFTLSRKFSHSVEHVKLPFISSGGKSGIYRIAERKESYLSKFKHLMVSWHVQTCKLVVSRDILNTIDHYHCLTYASPSEIKMYERSMVNISLLRNNESLICSYDKCTQVIISTSQLTHNVTDCLLENLV